MMRVRLPSIVSSTKRILKLPSKEQQGSVPKGHVAVYVGDGEKKRFVLPLSYLNNPSFRSLLNLAEEEFGYNHPYGGLTIPCKQDEFINLTCQWSSS